MNENGGNSTSAELQIVGSGEKIHGWGWHALMVGNVWVSLPVLTLAGLWAGEISTNLILIAGILGSIVGGLFPWIGGYIGAKFSLPNTLLSRASWGSKGGVVSSLTTIMAGIGWYATHLLLTALVIIGILETILHVSASYTIIVIIAAGLLSLGLGFAGVNYISKMAKYFVPILLGLIIVMFVIAMQDVGWSYHNITPLHSTLSFGEVVSVSFSVFVMSFIFSGDYGRYLKNKNQSFGGAIGPIAIQSFFIVVGVMMYSATGSVDLVSQLIKMHLIIEAGFIAVAVTVVTNVTNMYVPGLALTTAVKGYGKNIHRHIATIMMGIIGLILTVIVYTHLTYFGFLFDFLTLVGAIFASANAVVITDFFLRKKNYKVKDLMDVSKSSSYYYKGGYNLLAIFAFIVGSFVGYFAPGKFIPLFDGFAASAVIYIMGYLVLNYLKASIKTDAELQSVQSESIQTEG
jgi:purine-cytosine permease-like protein